MVTKRHFSRQDSENTASTSGILQSITPRGVPVGYPANPQRRTPGSEYSCARAVSASRRPTSCLSRGWMPPLGERMSPRSIAVAMPTLGSCGATAQPLVTRQGRGGKYFVIQKGKVGESPCNSTSEGGTDQCDSKREDGAAASDDVIVQYVRVSQLPSAMQITSPHTAPIYVSCRGAALVPRWGCGPREGGTGEVLRACSAAVCACRRCV